jgi:hypothetical protein
MARIILGSYMVRYPLGGMMSWVLQYLVGFHRLGHDVYFVEKAGYANSCYDPVRDVMTDDCTHGTATVDALLTRFGLGAKWCFVDFSGRYHGLAQDQIEAAFNGADIFIDMGTHGAWAAEAAMAQCRVLIDGEPGFTQMKMEMRLATGEALPDYDHYFTTGQNIGTARSDAPTAGKTWRKIFHPVAVDLFEVHEPSTDAPFSTVMNWQSHSPLEFRGRIFGQKDVEFAKFVDLPQLVSVPLEIAVSGKDVPRSRLKAAGWRLHSGHEATISYNSFVDYIQASRGEFGVCKNVFVATRSGWFSDRSAAYLAAGRPVVMQDTGFSEHLPCGEGLFAVNTPEEAAAALNTIAGDYPRHSRAARTIATRHLETSRVLGAFLHELGI